MLQRIQSLYLLLAAIFGIAIYLTPLFVFTNSQDVIKVYACHVTGAESFGLSMVPLAFMPLLSVLLSVLAIFSFKNRSLQLKLGKFNMAALAVVIVIAAIYFFRMGQLLEGNGKPGFSIILPMVSIVLVWMANKAIKKDDDLVKSADRIR